jgi:hypothetical protein
MQAGDAGGGHDLRCVAAHDRRLLEQQPAGRLIAIARRADADGIEHPRAAEPSGDLGRSLHADDPILRQRADVDDERAGDRAEVLRLLRRMDHCRRGADRQQSIGGDVHRHEIGHRLNERAAVAQNGEQTRALLG